MLDRLASLQEGKRVENIVLFQYKDLYTNLLVDLEKHENPAVKRAAQSLREVIEDKVDVPNFWYIVRSKIKALDAAAGKALNSEQTDYGTRLRTALQVLLDASKEYTLKRQITKDYKTGLPNRQAFDQDLTSCKENPMGQTVFIAFVDMDILKTANDVLTHEGADKLIKLVGEKISNAAKVSGVDCESYRVAGDEFAILGVFDGTNYKEALQAIQGILDAAVREDFVINGITWRQTLSCGVTFLKDTELADQEGALMLADNLHYLAKATRGEVVRNNPKSGVSEDLKSIARKHNNIDRGSSRWAITWLPYTDHTISQVENTNFILGPRAERDELFQA